MINNNSLYEHYCNTNEKISEKIKERNKFFVFIFIPIILLLFLSPSFDSFRKLFIDFFLNNYKINVSNCIEIIELILWIGLLYFTIRYCQANVYIERTYFYITKLENTLKDKYEFNILLESKIYLDDYPLILSFIDKIYKYLFPFLYIVFLIFKMSSLFISNMAICLHVFDFLIGLLCFIQILLYLFFIFDIDKVYTKESKKIRGV